MPDRKIDINNPKHLRTAVDCLYTMRDGTASEEERDFFEAAQKEAQRALDTVSQRVNEVLTSDWWNENIMEIFVQTPFDIIVIDKNTMEVIKTYGLDEEIDRTNEYVKSK